MASAQFYLLFMQLKKNQLNVDILHKSKIYGRSIVNLFVPLYTVLPSIMQNVFNKALLLSSVCIAVFLWLLNEEFLIWSILPHCVFYVSSDVFTYFLNFFFT